MGSCSGVLRRTMAYVWRDTPFPGCHISTAADAAGPSGTLKQWRNPSKDWVVSVFWPHARARQVLHAVRNATLPSPACPPGPGARQRAHAAGVGDRQRRGRAEQAHELLVHAQPHALHVHAMHQELRAAAACARPARAFHARPPPTSTSVRAGLRARRLCRPAGSSSAFTCFNGRAQPSAQHPAPRSRPASAGGSAPRSARVASSTTSSLKRCQRSVTT